MKFFSKLLISLLSLILLLAAAIWVLSNTISPQSIKDYLNKELSARTAQPIHINGAIKWKIFPHPGVKIENIQIGNSSPDNSGNTLIVLDKVFLDLNLSQLFRGQFVFTVLNVDGFSINLNLNAAQNKFAPAEMLINNKIPAQNLPHLTSSIAIERVLLSRGQVIIEKNEDKLTLTNLQIGATYANLQQKSFPIQLKSYAQLTHLNQLKAKSSIQFKGHINIPQRADLEGLIVNGQLALNDSQFDQIKIDKLSANTRFKNAVLQCNPLNLSLYQGVSTGDLTYNLKNRILQVNQTINSINSAHLSQDLFSSKVLSGMLDLSIHAQTNLSAASWQNATRAAGNITVRNGTIETIDLNTIIKAAGTRLNDILSKGTLTLPSQLNADTFADLKFFKGGTPFTLLNLQYRLENHLFYSDALFLHTDLLELKGDGQLNLLDYSLNNHLQATVAFTEKKVMHIQEQLGGAFPLVVTGSLFKPLVIPDLKKITPILAQALIKNTLTHPAKDIKNQLTSVFQQISHD